MLRARVVLDPAAGTTSTVFVAHLESERPIRDPQTAEHDPREEALGKARALIRRAAEAAALRPSGTSTTTWSTASSATTAPVVTSPTTVSSSRGSTSAEARTAEGQARRTTTGNRLTATIVQGLRCSAGSSGAGSMSR